MNEKSFCDDATVAIDYLNGTLDERTKTAFEEHLRRCERCRTEIDELRAVIEDLASVEIPAVPVALVDRVRARVRTGTTAVAGREDRVPRGAPGESRRRIAYEGSQPHRRLAFAGGLVFALCAVGVLTVSLALLLVFASDPVERFLETHLLGTVLDTARSFDRYGEDTLNILGMLFTAAGILLIPSIAEHLYALIRYRRAASRYRAPTRAAGSRP